MVVGAFQAEVLRHFAQANSWMTKTSGLSRTRTVIFEAYLDLDEVDDEEFEPRSLLPRRGFVDIDGSDFDWVLLVSLGGDSTHRSTSTANRLQPEEGSRRRPCRRRSGPGRPRSRRGTDRDHRRRAVALQIAQAHRSQHADELHRHVHGFRDQGRRLALGGVLARGPLRCFRCFLGALAFSPSCH